ncbi:hypothetical protein [Bartonella senegalensis]|uniref:hypothetical protein n=1 Tax=Bartonella senegalensis TaxID=1468418 RepID=UPI0002D27423|nr:hypothetical protein [Bartonella senegalensis]
MPLHKFKACGVQWLSLYHSRAATQWRSVLCEEDAEQEVTLCIKAAEQQGNKKKVGDIFTILGVSRM